MTKEITKAIILQEMQDKFHLREFASSPFLFDETVVPVYNVEQHLKTWEILTETVSITSAAGFVYYIVPAEERWLLRSYQVIFGGTGAHKGTGLYISNRPTSPSIFMYLDMKKDQDVSYLVNLPVPVVLESGNVLRYLINSYTSTQTLTIDIDVQKETIR